jgi:ribose 5-phosphate isomerase A
VRFAWRDTRRRLLGLVPSAELRLDDNGAPVATDEGHYILDCAIPGDGDLAALGAALKAEVGVVEHGFFIGLTSLAVLGNDDGSVERLSPR